MSKISKTIVIIIRKYSKKRFRIIKLLIYDYSFFLKYTGCLLEFLKK